MTSNGVTPDGPLLSGEVRREAEAIVGKYPNPRSAMLPLLFLVQSIEGYVSEKGMREVAELLELTPAQVLASASFYTMLKKKPQGDYLISVCRNISCTHMGARAVVEAFEDRLGVGPGETTPDGKFSLETAECLATCDGAPSGQINYEDVYRLTPGSVGPLVDKLERGEEVKSVRGEPIKPATEIAREIAIAGLGYPSAGSEEMRTIGGETPRADTAPGFRPKVVGREGDSEETGEDDDDGR